MLHEVMVIEDRVQVLIAGRWGPVDGCRNFSRIFGAPQPRILPLQAHDRLEAIELGFQEQWLLLQPR
jgi:hypothetical protein